MEILNFKLYMIWICFGTHRRNPIHINMQIELGTTAAHNIRGYVLVIVVACLMPLTFQTVGISSKSYAKHREHIVSESLIPNAAPSRVPQLSRSQPPSTKH